MTNEEWAYEHRFDDMFITAEQAAYKAYDIIDGYYGGKRKRLHTRFPKLNADIAGGFEYNTVNTIAGRSSSGKTSLLTMFMEDFIEDNPKLKILCFSFEMSAEQNMLKFLSNQLKMPMRDLYSADRKLSPEQVNQIKMALSKLKLYPITFITNAVTPAELEEIVKARKTQLEEGESLMVAIDHTLLLKGVKSDDAAKFIIDDLQRRLIELKKHGLIVFFQLAQLNRNIDESGRRTDATQHYPISSDLSDSSAMQNASDVVLVIHNPAHLNIEHYGPRQLSTKDRIFIHVLKNRFFGKIGKMEMYTDDLEHNNLIEL